MNIFKPLINKLKSLGILNNNDDVEYDPYLIFNNLIINESIYQFNYRSGLICDLKILKDDETISCLTSINNNDFDILCFVDVLTVPKSLLLSFSDVFSEFLSKSLFEFTDKYPTSIGGGLFAHNLYFLSTIPMLSNISFHYKAMSPDDVVFSDKFCTHSEMKNCNYGLRKDRILHGLYELCKTLNNYPELIQSETICFRKFFCCFSQNYVYYLLYLHMTHVQCKVNQLGRWTDDAGAINLDVNNVFHYDSCFSNVCMIQLAMHSLFIGDNLREYFYRTCCKILLSTSKTFDRNKFHRSTIIHNSNCYYLSDVVHAKLLVSVIISPKFRSKFPVEFIIAATRMLHVFLNHYKPVSPNSANDVLLKIGVITLHLFLNHLNYVCYVFQNLPLPINYQIPDDLHSHYGADEEFASLFLSKKPAKIPKGHSTSICLRKRNNSSNKRNINSIDDSSPCVPNIPAPVHITKPSSVSITTKSAFVNTRSSAPFVNTKSSAPDSSSCIYKSIDRSLLSNTSTIISSSVLNSEGRSSYDKHSGYDDIMVNYKSPSPKLVVPKPISPSVSRVLRSNRNVVVPEVLPVVAPFRTPTSIVVPPVVNDGAQRRYDPSRTTRSVNKVHSVNKAIVSVVPLAVSSETVSSSTVICKHSSCNLNDDFLHRSLDVGNPFPVFLEAVDAAVDALGIGNFMTLASHPIVDDTDNHSSNSDIHSCASPDAKEI